jgi:hypothetical protein
MALAGRDAQGFAIPGLGEGGDSSGGSGWKVTCWCQGWVSVPTTISRFGTSARTPKPSPSVSSTSPRGPGGGRAGRGAWPGPPAARRCPSRSVRPAGPCPWRPRRWSEGRTVGLGGLAPPTSSLSEFPPGLVSPGWHRRPARTTDRWRPLGSDAVWTNGGPARPARGGSGAPRRGPCRGKVDPRRLPPTSEPRLGDRLVRGSPGGVWARDIPLYRRAVPGHRHGDTPARWVCKPHGRSSGDERRLGLPALAGG